LYEMNENNHAYQHNGPCIQHPQAQLQLLYQFHDLHLQK